MPGTSSLDVDLTGRTCLVTGANTGIGRSTAIGLADRGAHVLLACRSAERATEVLDEINTAPGDGSASFVPLDLADLPTVRSCAEEVLERLAPDRSLDLLVNNAGLAGKKGVTEQGFELTFGVNHLGHFLLTTLLLDKLVASAPARVVNLTSTAHNGAKGIDFAALQQPTRSPAGLVEYQVAKLCNLLFTQELARRLEAHGTGGPQGVTTFALHPGVIASDIWRQVPWPIRPIMTLFMGSVDSGAARTLQCALDPALADRSGAYLERGRPKEPSAVATPELAAELWQRSEAWTEK
ncbi:MAG TPA: SDR family NAD(P)-dependent oxidoreductase [Acidimicrobiales bacterium]|nr:SDR family NAD(P)-dependent oxidoreductase [Acidimicrobiales bacterium]